MAKSRNGGSDGGDGPSTADLLEVDAAAADASNRTSMSNGHRQRQQRQQRQGDYSSSTLNTALSSSGETTMIPIPAGLSVGGDDGGGGGLPNTRSTTTSSSSSPCGAQDRSAPRREFSLSRLLGGKPKGGSSGGVGGGGVNNDSRTQQQPLPPSQSQTPGATSATAEAEAEAEATNMGGPATAGQGNDSLTSLNSNTSKNSNMSASDGSCGASRTGNFSVASLPAFRTSIRRSGLLSPHRRLSHQSQQSQQDGDSGDGAGGGGGGGGSGRQRGISRLLGRSSSFSSPGSPRTSKTRGANTRKSSIDLTMGGDRGYGSTGRDDAGDAWGGKLDRARQQEKKRVVDLDDFDFVHPRKVDEPALGGNVGVVPTGKPGETIRVYVAEKLFYSQVKGRTFRMHSNTRCDVERWERRQRAAKLFGDDGRGDLRLRQQHQAGAMAAVEEVGSAEELSTPPPPQDQQQQQQQQRQDQRNTNFNDGIDSVTLEASVPYDLVGKTSHSKDRLVLKDRDGHTIGVIVKRYVHYDRRFDIYGVQPISPSQRPAENQRTKDGDPLYLRARVIGNLKGKLSIDMFSGNNRFRTDVYRVHKLKTGFLEGKTLYFTKQDRMAALLKQGAFPKGVQGPAWDGTIAPGIDPCLMVCLIAILDETNKI